MNSEEPNTQPQPIEAPQPQPTPTAPHGQADAVLFGIVVSFAVMIYFSCKIGYDQGLRIPGEVLLGPLVFAILSILFSILELCFCARIVNDGFHGIVSWMVFPALLVAPLMLGSYYNWSFNYGECAGLGKQSREKAELRTITKALDFYNADCHAYPPSLEALVASDAWKDANRRLSLANQEFRIPSSAFDKKLTVRYALVNPVPAPSAADVAGLVWLPGPDRNYDIQDGPELRAALTGLQAGASEPWLAERTYDPSNGASGGDMVRFFPEREKR